MYTYIYILAKEVCGAKCQVTVTERISWVICFQRLFARGQPGVERILVVLYFQEDFLDIEDWKIWHQGQFPEKIAQALELGTVGTITHRIPTLRGQGSAFGLRQPLSLSSVNFWIKANFFAIEMESAFCPPLLLTFGDEPSACDLKSGEAQADAGFKWNPRFTCWHPKRQWILRPWWYHAHECIHL